MRVVGGWVRGWVVCVCEYQMTSLLNPPPTSFRNRYSTDHWVSKNADALPPNLQKVMKTSSVDLVHELFNTHHKKVSCMSLGWIIFLFVAFIGLVNKCFFVSLRHQLLRLPPLHLSLLGTGVQVHCRPVLA